ncbi:MAG: glutathione S-transferase [Maricaulis sp.]|nr:glutathione S-transferase [Maricaulis sp.]
MRIARPILYSFRRCPYAMRARMALHAAKIDLEHREVLLRDKPAAMLSASPKGTVPVLVTHDGTVLEQSLDIMHWALNKNDPHGWLKPQTGRTDAVAGLIADNDGPFKTDLDRYKYADRHPDDAPDYHRDRGLGFLARLDSLLAENGQLFGAQISLADIAIFPFVRQFANTDLDWFDTLPLPALQHWLADHIGSELFETIMVRHTTWQPEN